MKLAEALMMRSDLQKKINQLRERLQRSAVMTEGDAPPESVQTLRDELKSVIQQYESIIYQINVTNTATVTADGSTLTALLARRDAINKYLPVLEFLLAHTNNAISQHRNMRSELRAISYVDVPEVQKDIDRLSAELRQIDNSIQKQNWLTDLVE